MKKLITFLLIYTITFSTAYAEYFIDLQATQITIMRTHTTHHASVNARRMVLANIAGLNDGCNLGVFFDSSQNAETLSVFLTAFVTKKNVRIGYEPNIRSPWGDTNYCALTAFDIK